MPCNCIEEQEAILRKETGDNEAFIAAAFDVKEKQRRFSAQAYYRGKILGIFKKNLSLAYLSFDYCPFCGKKYIEDVQIKKVRIKLKRDKATADADFPKGIEHDAYVNRHGRLYLQDTYGEKIYLKPCDYAEVGHVDNC
jgi:hypothetical protein